MASNENVAKATLWYTVSNFILKGIGFFTTPIFARVLTMEEYGQYNNFTTWLSLLTIISTLSLSASLISARKDYKEDFSNYVGNIIVVGTISVAIVFVLMFALGDYVINYMKLDFKYICVMGIVMLFSPAYDIFMFIQRLDYKYKLVAYITVSVSISSVLLSLLFIIYGDDNLWGRVLGANLPLLLVACYIYFFYLSRIKQMSLSYINYSLAICVPYIFHSLSGIILNSSDRLMITYYLGEKYTALYSMGGNIALVISVLWSSMNAAYIPWLADNLAIKDYDKIKKFSYSYIAIFVYIVIGFMLIAPEALFVMGGEDYLVAKDVIPPIMLGYILVFLYSMYALIEQIEKKTVWMAIATAIAAITNICLNIFFIEQFGYITAAYTTVISYFILFILHYFFVHKMGYTGVYDSKYVGFNVVATVAICFLILSLYDHVYIRYFTILVYLFIGSVVLIKYKTSIFRLIGLKK